MSNQPPKFEVPFSWKFQILEGNLPIAFGWDKNGGRLSPAEDATLSIRSNDQYSSTLIIDRLQFGHRGNYTCTASNAAGSATYTAELTVNGACSFDRSSHARACFSNFCNDKVKIRHFSKKTDSDQQSVMLKPA